MAFVTEDSSLALEALSSFDFHDPMVSFGFLQLLWLLFLSLFLYHPLNIPQQCFRASISSHSTLLCVLPNLMALITTSILTTLKSLSQARLFPKLHIHISICLVAVSSWMPCRLLGLHMPPKEQCVGYAPSGLLQSYLPPHLFCFSENCGRTHPSFLRKKTSLFP